MAVWKVAEMVEWLVALMAVLTVALWADAMVVG